MKEILIKNSIVKIDYDKVSRFTWHINPNGYVKSNKNIFIIFNYIVSFEKFSKRKNIVMKWKLPLQNRKLQ